MRFIKFLTAHNSMDFGMKKYFVIVSNLVCVMCLQGVSLKIRIMSDTQHSIFLIVNDSSNCLMTHVNVPYDWLETI